MNIRSKPLVVTLGAVVLVASAVYTSRIRAAGIPATRALTYSGMLRTPTGEVVTGTHNIGIAFWDSEQPTSGTLPLCLAAPASTTLTSEGRFLVSLPDNCVTAVKGTPNLWAEVQVDGGSLGRTRLGAVPYAVEAERAGAAYGSLQTTLEGLATKTDLATVDAKASLSTLVTIAGPGFKDVRLNASNSTAQVWSDLPERSLKFTKRFKSSRLKITYQDTLGNHSDVYQACTWQILLDTTSILSFSDADLGDATGARGWRMSNAAHVAWAPESVAVGEHTVKVQWRGDRGAWGTAAGATSECLAGWNTNGSFLSVEEIP